MTTEDLRNLMADMDGKLGATPGDITVPRAWFASALGIVADAMQQAAHLQSQPVPAHLRRAQILAGWRPALQVVGGREA